MKKDSRVVVVGGGTGTYQVLSGLKKYPNKLSAIISMCDSGGSTGRLRKELGVLPPGDIRRAILALSDLPFAQNTLEELFDFRFKKGQNLRNHSVGNILLAALTQITGSMDKAIEEAARILQTTGDVYPVTLDKTNLVAVLNDGTRIFGETNIDRRQVKPKIPINKVYLNPGATIYKKASSAIEKADYIILCPGDLYSSLIPVLLVKGVVEAINKSKADLVYIVNLMTKKGETDNFKASDFVNEVQKYLCYTSNCLKYVLVNKSLNHSRGKVRKWYKKYGNIPVENDLKSNKEYKVITKDFLGAATFFRHDPIKLAKTIQSLA